MKKGEKLFVILLTGVAAVYAVIVFGL